MKTTKKPAVKAVKKSEPTKAKKETSKKNDAKIEKKISSQLNMLAELTKIADAYGAAIDGKIKFGKVKEMFKKLHKEVKKSSKK